MNHHLRIPPISPAVIMLCFLTFSFAAHAQMPETIVKGNKPERIFAYTNRVNAFYCGVVNGDNTSGFHGVTCSKQKLFENYWIVLGNDVLDRTTAVTTVTPAGMLRKYPAYNTREEICFIDSLMLLCVRITTDYRGEILIIPGWSPVFRGGTESINEAGFGMVTSMKTRAWVDDLPGRWEATDPILLDRTKNAAPVYAPAMYAGTPSSPIFAFNIEFADSVDAIPNRTTAELIPLIKMKARRIERSIADIGFWCDNAKTTDAFKWISSSLDAMTMRQSGVGLYAGLPWFDDYWGRDTFISFEGAYLVTGRFETAKAVLNSFASMQNADASSSDYGRIPNRVTPGETIYNTVDGTPWFVISVWNYIERSGDRAYVKTIFPFIERATKGTIEFHTDISGLVTHNDADTWMDAVGPHGPWSPRGNRAVEIQTLWIKQLEVAAKIARMLGYDEKAELWEQHAIMTYNAFVARFIDNDNCLIDHITNDNIADNALRPNALLAIDPRIAPELPAGTSEATLKRITASCVYPYGVASLSQTDSNFHPYHYYPQSYPKDAAYHNGTIWTWLTGRAVDALCRAGAADSARVLTHTLETLLDTQGAVGTLPECMDAIAKSGTTGLPQWSGTFSQSWSNAEYIRTMVEDYLGVNPSVDERKTLRIRPNLPSDIHKASVNSRIGNDIVTIEVNAPQYNKQSVTVKHISGAGTIDVVYQPFGCEAVQGVLTKGAVLTLKAGRPIQQSDSAKRCLSDLHFCTPEIGRHVKALRAPDYPLLDGAEISKQNTQSRLIWSGIDAENDDRGPDGAYTYPGNPLFKSGIFDIRGCTVTADDNNLYITVSMRALSQPGWHPEYGFQLTELALAIQTSPTAGLLSTHIGENSNAVLPKSYAYDRLILIGGGFVVKNAGGDILAAYIPTDERYAFGNATTGVINIAVPLSFIGRPGEQWRFALVSGGQDDHGGAGIGEFRTVLPTATEWNGGGNPNHDINIYDELYSNQDEEMPRLLPERKDR